MASDDDANAEQTVSIRRAALLAPVAIALGHYLTFSQDGVLRRVRIGPDGLTIGRTPPCDLIIPMAEISRRHCRIEREGDAVLASDLGSTNGTFVGGRRLERRLRLRNGAVVALGSFEIRYETRDLREVEEETRLAEDLRGAVEYVRAILPEPIAAGPVRTDWWFVPSLHLGGDAFGYQFLSETMFAGFLLDVTGHGIGAAMHAVNVANVWRRRALPDTDMRDPAQVAAALNALFPMEEHGGLMLTLWGFSYDTTSRKLRFSAAGHHAALLVAPDAAEPELLTSRGPAIGMLPAGRWTAGRARIAPGSRLYIFSDGAFEIPTTDGTSWGMRSLAELVRRPEQAGVPESQRVYQSVRAAARPGPLPDDFSVLVLRFE
jgi:serine phosphatase RsbU (regulator of sigma subunit)